MEEPHDTAHRKRGLLAGLRASFLTGLVVVLPIGLTIYLVYTVVGWIDGWILPVIPWGWRPDQLVAYYLGPDANFPTRGLGVIVFLVFTIIVGWIAKGLIGRSILAQAEALVDRMPVVRSVYGGFKQITETFFAKSEKSFDRTCLVEFPRPGSWAVGFVATTAKGEIAAKLPSDKKMIAVFVALTPLTSGILLFVPEEDVIFLDMKADDAVKLIVSAGLVSPGTKEVQGLLAEQPAQID
ncbi:Uncharacterized membrane protein [Gemmobacter aquatilis]|uniref:Uncharacterized membrane protein n=1 Tax=Gemmobacter aquatilis TaxID=933059 RepID=A0A1H8B0V6_9RHOB|nr:DUF502 domain-containing protein [Gemmobacter aquatilis]SEM76413.1 Uncharacterized membrane protein [Gemmobacter aquatilis]